ncbi:MAG: Nif11-like leader peptide family RiPP precursor [Christensenella sp.]|nr:Nif11-like leader peptide family RiPP precursor [Christensenella sp.]
MTDKFKSFLKKVNEDEALFKKMEALQGETDRKTVIEKTIEIAKEAGIALSPADFEAGDGEMDDAEMQAVSGGWCKCVCVTGGGGKEDAQGGVCACVLEGAGMRKGSSLIFRCACVIGGYGYKRENM